MSVKIRLMRIGAKKKPFYRIVAVDERKKRTGSYLELLGTYNPLTEPKEVNLKQDRINEWVKKGAILSDGFLRVIGKAVQKPPRKPKKESKQVIVAESEPRSEELGNSEQKNPENPDKTEDHKNLEPEEKSQADDLSKTEEPSSTETS